MKRNKEEQDKVKSNIEKNGHSSGQIGDDRTCTSDISKKLIQSGGKAPKACAFTERCSEKLRKAITGLKYDDEKVPQTSSHIGEMNEILNDCDVLISVIEEKVTERTKEIAALNIKLTEYARYTSHELRAPLARILGLIGLMNMDFRGSGGRLDEEKQKFYIDKISSSATELDEKVRTVVLLLNEPPADNF